MKKIMYCLMALTLVLTCSCCKTSKKNVKADKFPLIGTQWMLVALEGEVITKNFALHPFITFDTAGSFQGNLGCNSFFGTYEVNKKQKMVFQYQGSTKRLCQNMEVEKHFIAAMKREVTNYELKGDELFLLFGNEEIMRFKGVNLNEVE